MGELLAVACECCGDPMIPNVSTLDDDGCGWICINPDCARQHAGELELDDLVEAGVPAYLAGRLVRLVDSCVEGGRRPFCAHERAWVALAALIVVVRELRRRAARAAAEAERLNDELLVSFTSNDFDLAQDSKQALAIAAAFCCSLQRSADDVERHLAAIDPQLDGLQTVGWG